METFKDVISGDQLVLTSSSSFLQGIVKRTCLCSCFVRRLVDFFATWCQPCKMMHPILEPTNEREESGACSSYPERGGGRRSQQVKNVLGDIIRIIKVDVDKYGVTASQPMEQREQKPSWLGLCRVATEEDDSQYRIQSVLTLMLFRNGEVLWRTSGVVDKAELLATLDPFLK